MGISLPFFVQYLLILTDPGLQRSGTLLHWFVVVVLPILVNFLDLQLSTFIDTRLLHACLSSSSSSSSSSSWSSSSSCPFPSEGNRALRSLSPSFSVFLTTTSFCPAFEPKFASFSLYRSSPCLLRPTSLTCLCSILLITACIFIFLNIYLVFLNFTRNFKIIMVKVVENH